MTDMLTLTDPFGRPVRLSGERWARIRSLNPGRWIDLATIGRAVTQPSEAMAQRFDLQKQNFILHRQSQPDLCVVVRYHQGQGDILSAFAGRSIRSR